MTPAAAFYRGVCLASLGKPEEARAAFKLYLSANPDKDIDRKAYSKKVVAAFEKARVSAARSGTEELSALAAAYRETTYPRSRSEPPGPDWAAGPVRFLLTPEEIRTFSRISDDSEGASSSPGSGSGAKPSRTSAGRICGRSSTDERVLPRSISPRARSADA